VGFYNITTEPTWIFGYGSLIWRTGFDFVDSQAAFIRGWSRRFWQGSTDHRGVPGAPGRVVTLIEAPAEICWGMAYRISPGKRDEVMALLDHREKGGYQRLQIPLYFDHHSRINGITYLATTDNPNYLGETGLERIAEQILTSCGPSGENSEYVLRLDQALAAMGAEDSHVKKIADILKNRVK
jgi:cation transport protein ChaC